MQASQMQTLSLAPSAALRPYVERFLIVEYTAGKTNTLLPGTGIVAAFRFKGNCLVDGDSAPNSLVTGLRDSAHPGLRYGVSIEVREAASPVVLPVQTSNVR